MRHANATIRPIGPSLDVAAVAETGRDYNEGVSVGRGGDVSTVRLVNAIGTRCTLG
jgi:hypothetical protein